MLLQAEMLRRMRKLLRRWVNKATLSAFNEWEALLRERQMLKRALHLAINMGMGRGFRRWAECAEERQRLRGVAERVMRRMLKRALAASFDGW